MRLSLHYFSVRRTELLGERLVAATDDHFETYIVAAIIKKKVPASVVDKAERATLILKPALVKEHKETTGSKVVKCLFAYCAGTNDKANTSVQLLPRYHRSTMTF